MLSERIKNISTPQARCDAFKETNHGKNAVDCFDQVECAFHDGFERGAKWAQKLALERTPGPGWISVETAMPTVAGREYWCWVVPGPGFEHSDGTVTRGDFKPHARIVKTYLPTRTNTVRFNCGALQQVTHWMDKPFPPQPKEAE